MFRSRWFAAAAVIVAMVLAGLAIWPWPEPSTASMVPRGFRGRVADRDGSAVAGAHIEATWIGQDEAPRTLGSARVDAQGRYLLSVEPPAAEQGVLALRVSAAGFGAVGRRVTLAESRQDFRLTHGATELTVRVVAEDGQPVIAADVVVSVEPVAGSPDALIVLAGKTGADGAWRFGELGIAPAELHWIASASGTGRGFGALHKLEGDAPVEIAARLAAGSELIGDLVDREGKLVTGATIVARELEGPWRDSASSGPEGAARIVGAPREVPLTLEVSGDWVLAGDSEVIPLRFAATERSRHVALVVEPAGRIDGKVMTARGEPVASAVVSATPSDHVLTRNNAVATGPDGSFALRGLRSRTTWDLEVRHPAHAPAFQDRVAATTRGLRIDLHDGGSLVGGVDDDVGRPLPGIEVYAHRIERGADQTTHGLREYATVKTGPDGGFRIEHLSAGDYRVEYRSPVRMAWSPTATQLAAATLYEGQESSLDRVRLARGASLRVVARDAHGEPIAHHTMKVSILPADQGGAPHRVDARTGADGSFQIDNLVSGSYQVAVRSERHGYARSADLRLVTAATALFDARFPEAYELAGTVVDAGRHPVAGALVDAYTADPAAPGLAAVGRPPDNFSGNFTRTDEAGHFRVAGLTAGSYRLRVSSASSVPFATSVSVPAPTTPLALQLAAPATLHVSVAGPQTTGSVVIESHDGAGFSASKAIGPDGTVDFTMLPAGDYQVRAGLDRMFESHAEVHAGSDQRVHFDRRSPTAPSP